MPSSDFNRLRQATKKTRFSEFSSFMKAAPAERDPVTRRVRHATAPTNQISKTANQTFTSKMVEQVTRTVRHATISKSKTVVPKQSLSTNRKTVELIAAALGKVSRETGGQVSADPLQVAVAVEKALHDTQSNNKTQANAKLRSLLFNLNDSRNPDFRRKVLSGQIKPESIPTLKPEQMASDKRLEEDAQLLREKMA